LFKGKSLHLILFLVTLTTTTLAGAEWVTGAFIDSWDDIGSGLLYSVPFLTILTVHEFGHYFMARFHKIRTSLPYYLPFYFPFVPSIGTMGAFIKILTPISSRKIFFDIGIAGPLAGFVVAIGVLFYGFTHLPPQEYLHTIHPEYETLGKEYVDSVYKNNPNVLSLGTNLTFKFFEEFVVEDKSLIPNQYEMMHYPWLFAGYLALFFTALNLVPIGQLDGGHILYGLIGYKRHTIVSICLFVLLIFYAGLGIATIKDINETTDLDLPFVGKVVMDIYIFKFPLYIAGLYIMLGKLFKEKQNVLLLAFSIFTVQFLVSFLYPGVDGYPGWLLFCFILGRVLGIYHPPALYDEPLDLKRKILGWISLIVFIISFSPTPFQAS
jgi:membrane-associated protease RseP (regulator of RpoE activity)